MKKENDPFGFKGKKICGGLIPGSPTARNMEWIMNKIEHERNMKNKSEKITKNPFVFMCIFFATVFWFAIIVGIIAWLYK